MKTISPKKKWRDIVKSKVMPAIKPSKGDLVDCVRVRITSNSAYLQEVATGKRMNYGTEYKMLQMDQKTLEDHQLIMESGKLVYRKDPSKNASTEGLTSKGQENLQAFVMGKDGNLYIATHTGRFSPDPSKPTLTHASFLSGVPAELAGMISINKQGKITQISNNSGHYAPDELDMYRGIKKLVVDIFDPKCQVKINGRSSQRISAFIKEMEMVQSNGKMLHENLRDARKNQIKEEIMSVSSLEHQIDYLLTHKVDQKTLYSLFEKCLDSQNFTLADKFMAKLQDIKKLKGFLNYKMASGHFPMHYIAYKGSMEMFKAALDHGADVKVKDRKGRTLLDYTAKPEMIPYLCFKGVEVDAIDGLGNTPLDNKILDYKAFLNNPGCSKELEDTKQAIFALFDNGANTDKFKDEPIIKETKQVQEILSFIESKGSNNKYNYQMEDKLNALSEGSLARCLTTKDKHGNTMLHMAARYGNLELCELLLDKGADVLIKNNDGKQAKDLSKERPNRTWKQWLSNILDQNDIKYPSKKDLNKVYQKLSRFKIERNYYKDNKVTHPVDNQAQLMVEKTKNRQAGHLRVH